METQPYRPGPERETTDPRVDAAMQLLEAGVDRLMDTDEFRHFLEFQSRFHTYSWKNQMLIWSQNPEATRVMGYGSKDHRTGWLSVGRQVRAGERAIKIFAPLLKKDIDPDTGEIVERLRGYKLVNVFDVAQTDGEPLPEGPRPQELATSSEYGRRLYGWTRDHLAGLGVPVFRSPVPGSPEARGAWLPALNKVVVHPELADDMAAKTLVHEAAHVTGDHKGWEDKPDIETQAEAAAFVTTTHFGLDTADYSFAYIAHWAQDRDVFKRNLGRAQEISKTLINGIEGVASRTHGEALQRDSSEFALVEGLPQRLPSRDELGLA